MDMHIYRQVMKGREEMLEALNSGKRSWSNMACVNIIYDGETRLSDNQACHAGLDDSYNDRKGSHAVISGLMKPPVGQGLVEEEALYFLDWLLNESPYASTFITKSAEEALFYKATISSSFHPSNLMAAGMVASRRLWEYAHVARVFVDLAKAGVNKDLAFYLGHKFSGAFNRSGKCSWSNNQSAHCSIDPASINLKNFLLHKVVNPNRLYHEHENYYGYDGMHGGPDIKGWIHTNFPYNGKKVEVKKVNPFPVDEAKVGNKQTTYDDLILGMVEFQYDIFAHIGYEQRKKAA